MKNSQVISIPKVVSEWLEIQLEAKGLDYKVYARYIISLLHAHTLKVIFEKGVRVRRLVGFSGPWWYHIHTDVEEIKSWGTIQGLISTEPGSEIETLVEELCKKINEAKEQELLLSYSNSNPETKENVVEETCTAKDSETRYYAAFPALKKSSLPSNLNLKKWPTVRGKKGSATGTKESSKKIKYCIKNYPRKTAMKKEMHNNLERQNVVKSANINNNYNDESDCDELMKNHVKENNNNEDNGTANFSSLELAPCGAVRSSTPTGRSNFSSSESELAKNTFVLIRKNFIERKELFPLTAEEKKELLAYDVNKYFADLPKEEVSVCAQDLPVSLSFLSDDDVDEEEISAIKDEYNTTKNPRHLLQQQQQQQSFPSRSTIEKQFFDQFFEFEMPKCLQQQDDEFLKSYNDILPLNFTTIFTPLVTDIIPLNEIKPLNDAKTISLMAINHDPEQSAFCVYSDINSSLRSKKHNKPKDFVVQPSSTTEYEELLKQQEIRNFVALEGPPIRNKEDVVKNTSLFKDGTVFTVNNQIKPVNYERSASGTKFLKLGDEEIKYLEYKGNLSIDSLNNDSLTTTGPIFKDNDDLDLGSYFKIHFALSNNDKACQTDEYSEFDEYATITNLKGCVGDERKSKNHSQTPIIAKRRQLSPQKNEEIIIIDDEEEICALNIVEKFKDMEEILYGNFEKICKEKTAWLEENDALFAAIKNGNNEEEFEEDEFEENYKRSKFFPTCRLSLEEFYSGTTPVEFIMNNMETNNNNNDNNYNCSDNITSWSTLSKYVFFPSAKPNDGIHQNHHSSSNNNNNNNNKSRFFGFTGNLEGNCLINLLQDNPAAHSVI